MSARKALGRGLDALIPSGPARGKVEGDLVQVEISRIKGSPTQPRKKFNDQSLQELADSIKSEGVLQPVLLKPDESSPGSFLLIAGERRLRAAKLAGLSKVPALVKKADERETLVMQLIENLQREDLNPIEEAQAFSEMTHKFKLSQEELAKKMGKDRSTVANTIRLLKLPGEIQAAIERGTVSAGHARAILALDSQAKMMILFRRIQNQGISVRQAEALAKGLTQQDNKSSHPRKPGQDRIYLEELERKLSRSFSLRVKLVETGKNKGKMEVYYSNLEELERIIGLVGKK
jgi:ParB family transcriptional regulator, chromosome partitioning protein